MANTSILIKNGTRAPKTTNYPAWEYALLSKRGWPATPTNLIALNLWAKSEGVQATANNPLAITNPNQEFGPDSGTLPGNSSGVATFGSISDGVNATSNFLNASSYSGIDAAFRNGHSLNAIYQAINASPWCANCSGGKYPVALSQYAGVGPVNLGSIPIYHGGAPSGSSAVQGGQAQSASSFTQCNKGSVLIGGLGFHFLDACQAKALVGGAIIGVGLVTVVLGGAIIMRKGVEGIAGGFGLLALAKGLGGRSGGAGTVDAPTTPDEQTAPETPTETPRQREDRVWAEMQAEGKAPRD